MGCCAVSMIMAFLLVELPEVGVASSLTPPRRRPLQQHLECVEAQSAAIWQLPKDLYWSWPNEGEARVADGM